MDQHPLPSHSSIPDSRDPVASRKTQKADRERLRRDRLNDQFAELGNAVTVDHDRPKNDKGSILTETIQLLKELGAEVKRLKTEYAVLTEESRELTQEKSELREEKASLKSEIENLNIQYQQGMQAMFPWAPADAPVVMAPPYTYPVPLAVPPSSIPMHPTLQPFPFFGNQNPGAIPTHHPAFVPYPPPANLQVEQHSYASAFHPITRQDSPSKSSECQRSRNVDRSDDSNDVATELELKTPGSAGKQKVLSVDTKEQQSKRKEKAVADEGSSSRLSSSQGWVESPNSVAHV